MTHEVLGFVALTVIYILCRYLNKTDIPRIKDMPEIPGVPLFGNLLQMGTVHAKAAQSWVAKYGPVFQVRLGNRRVVFANDFDSVKHFWITNQSALISRPRLHTFHNVISSSEGLTIGASPWDESCKARRKAAATALNRPAVQSYMPLIDRESMASIKEMFEDSSKGNNREVDPVPYFQRFALNTSLSLTYGLRITGSIEDEMLNEIVKVEREIANFRSTSNVWQDYIPLLRLWPRQNTSANGYRLRRATYMNKLLSMLKERIANGTDKPCIIGNVLKDPDAVLNDAEIMSVGMTMVSAGLDTVPGNLIMGIGVLGSPAGQLIQARAYSEIMKVYPDNDAWSRCLHEEKVPYVTALVKEILRFFTVLPVSLPRVSIKPIQYNSATIPPGTTFYMNAYAADYDPRHFKNPYTFEPERYMDLSDGGGTPHYGYGAGSRMCAGSHLANRELYTAFVRLISAFEIKEARDTKDRAIIDCLEANAIPGSLTMEPKRFKCQFLPRDRNRLEEWIQGSDEQTRDL